jgi:hypothetical protein
VRPIELTGLLVVGHIGSKQRALSIRRKQSEESRNRPLHTEETSCETFERSWLTLTNESVSGYHDKSDMQVWFSILTIEGTDDRQFIGRLLFNFSQTTDEIHAGLLIMHSLFIQSNILINYNIASKACLDLDSF